MEILDCALCQVVVEAMYKVLGNPNVDHNIEHIVEKVCRILPANDQLKVSSKHFPQNSVYNININLR